MRQMFNFNVVPYILSYQNSDFTTDKVYLPLGQLSRKRFTGVRQFVRPV
jgi:hypothetical protein